VIRVRIRGVKYRTKYRNPVNQLTLWKILRRFDHKAADHHLNYGGKEQRPNQNIDLPPIHLYLSIILN
jgi:hypothetical protein